MQKKVRLRIDTDAVPNLLPVRRIALAFRTNFNSEIVHLEKLEVIAKVDERIE